MFSILFYFMSNARFDNAFSTKETRENLNDGLLYHARRNGHFSYNPICFTSINTSAMYCDDVCVPARDIFSLLSVPHSISQCFLVPPRYRLQ